MKYFSLFSGIGGFEHGIQQALDTNKKCKRTRLQGDIRNLSSDNTSSLLRLFCVGFSEIDKYAIQIYKKHFPTHKEYGNVSNIKWSNVPDFELLCGGFPCQSFSIAGKRGGFSDTRDTLFFEIARAAQEKQPRLLLLENVKGLLSHDKGKTFGTILNTLDELGYDLQWQVLNSKNFGVPQNRERVFIIGHLRTTSRPQVFPLQQSSKSNLKYCGGIISARERWLNDGKNFSRNFSQGQRIYSTKGISQTLAGNAGGQGGKTGLYQISETLDVSTQKTYSYKILSILQEKIGTETFTEWGLRILNTFQKKKILQPEMYGNGFRYKTNKEQPSMDDSPLSCQKIETERCLRNLWLEECERCPPQKPRLAGQFIRELTKNLSFLSQQNTPYPRIRRLTPLEAERLQGFPDGWTEGISDTQRYKCLGNAVTTYVIETIMEKLILC